MRPRRLAAVLALTLALDGPGVGGWVLFAQNSEVTYDNTTNKLRVSSSYSPLAAPTAIQKIDAAVAAGRITGEDAQRTKLLIERYGTSTPEVEAALTQLSADLDNPNKDAKLTLSDLYDRMSPAARKDEAVSTFVQVVNQTSASQSVVVKSMKTGATLFYQSSRDLAPMKAIRVISRPDPDGTGKKIIEAVIIVEEKGSAEEQRVLYNRKVHLLFKNLKRLYYDQCQLVRKINNGANPPTFKSEGCKINGQYQIGFKDPELTDKHFAKMREIYNTKQMEFDAQKFKMKNGQEISLRGYLALLDKAVAEGTTEQLAWEDLETAQRLAMKFYGKNQLEMMQKYVIIQLSSYFGQVTNSQPKQEKDGTEMLDASSKDIDDLQRALTQMEKGNLEGYGHVMRFFKLTELDHEDQKYVPPDLLLAAGEAFAYVSYAVKAKERAWATGLSGEEVDAAIEEGQQWLKLAQIQLQTFELHSLSIQMERLRDGKLRDNIGLLSGDTAGKAEATRLMNTATQQYLPRLRQASLETKVLMLKQSIATMYLGLQNAARAQLYSDTLRERLRTLAAKALELKSLYLAAEFEKVKDRPEFKGRSALDKLRGSAYEYFLNNLPADIKALSGDLDKFAGSLTALAGKGNADSSIRDAMRGKITEFLALAARLGYPQIPDLVKVREEGERQSIKQAQFFAALADHTTKMRIFDMLHELDQYLRRYASPEMPDSDNVSGWDKFVSFKWLDSAIDWVTGGGREKAIETGMKHFPLTKEAFAKLGGPAKDLRRDILSLMAQQKYDEAYKMMEKLDPEAAKRSLAEWESDQLEKDPFENMDMLSFMSKASEGKEAAQAQGVVGGLFKQLQTYILGYTGMAAAFDMVFMSVLTAGVGQFAKVFVAAGRGAMALANAMRAARTAEQISQLTRFQRFARVMMYINRVPVLRQISGVLRVSIQYLGKVGVAWGNNFKNTLELRKVTTVGGALRQFAFTSIPNAFRYTARNMMIMALASGGIQWSMYQATKENSQYKSGGDAFWQGALGGAKFGATGGILMLMTPIPVSALGNGTAGRLMQSLGNSSGPISGTISTVAKAIPRTSGSIIARQGVWGAVGDATLAASPAFKALANMAVWGGAMVDGALKFFLLAEGSKEIAEVGSFLVGKLMSDPNAPPDHGATSYVENMAAAQHFGLSVSQMSWILIPTGRMHGHNAMKQQKEQMYGFSEILRRNGGAGEIMETPNGQFMSYNRSAFHRVMNGEIFDMVMGRSQKQGRIQNNQQFKELASRISTKKTRTIGEIAALSTVNMETMSGRQKMSQIIAGMEGRAPQPPPATSGKPVKPSSSATPNTKAEAPQSRVTKIFSKVLDAKADGSAPQKVYAYFSKTGNLVRVSTKGGGKEGVMVELTVRPDGSLELTRAPGSTKGNAATLKGMSREVLAKIEDVITEVNVARTSGGAVREAVPLTAQALGELFSSETPGDRANKVYVYTTPEGVVMTAKPSKAGKPAENAVLLEFSVGTKGEIILAKTPEGDLTVGNAAAVKKLGKEVSSKLQDALAQFNATVTPKAPVKTTADDVFVTMEGVGSWRKLMEKHLSRDVAMRNELLTNRAETIELVDNKTGKTFTVTGESLKKLREMAAWRQLDAAPLGVLGTLKSIFFGNQGLPQGWWYIIPRKLMPWQYFAKGRLWKIATGREVGGTSEIIVMDLQQDVGSAVKSNAGSARRRIANVRDQVESLLKNSTGKDAEALTSLRDALSAQGRPEDVVAAAQAELTRLSGGTSPELLLKIKRRLSADEAPVTVVKTVLEMLEGVEGPAASALRSKLGGQGAKDPTNLHEVVGNTAAELKSVTEGAPFETLASFERSLKGEITASDLIHSAAKLMDARISKKSGLDAVALKDLRRTLEADAFTQLANQIMARTSLDYRSSGKSPADRKKLEANVDMLIDVWERGVFGQAFQVRVEKDGARVWDIPLQFQFKDANGNAIKSFRQGQLDAIRNDLISIAEGNLMIYNLLQTSGGKTLMSFVLVGFLQELALARGRDGATVVTANADLVAQGKETYKAFFKGREPGFEIIDYGELMVRQAAADEQGSLGPFETRDVIMDEFDFVGMGTPLSLGMFQGQLSFAQIDPVQAALRNGVMEAWDRLYSKFGKDVQSMQHHEFLEFRKNNPQFDKEFRDLVAKTTKEVREALDALDPTVSSTWLNPQYRRFRRDFIKSIPPEYAAQKGLTPHEIFIEMVREHRNAFGGTFKLGVLQAKYGSLEKWVEKVVEGGFEAASEGPGLSKLYSRDPQREGIIQYHNDQALDSLDTHYRTSLELKEGVPITLDFETQAVTDFRKINEAARDAGAVTIALSGTLPDGMRPFLKSIGVLVIGKGSDPNKAAGLPHQIIAPRPEVVKQFEKASIGKNLEVSVSKFGEVMGMGRVKDVAELVSVPLEVRPDSRLAVSAKAGPMLSKMTPEALENFGSALDLINASRVPNPGGTPLQFAATREGILRLLSDSKGSTALNIAYVWVESTAKMETLLKDLDTHGITMEKTSILTSPGSNFFLQERYMFKIKTEKNVEGIKAGEVGVVVLAGQGGLRGLEAPLQAYAGGEIRMFVTDSHTLADVSLVQLLGRIDRGRVPTTSKTTFVLLDDAATVMSNRNYREILYKTVINSAMGMEGAKLKEVERLMGGRPVDEAVVKEIFTDANLIEAKNAYRDYLALRKIRETVPAEELAALEKLPPAEQRAAALKLMERSDVMKILVVELRRLAEKDALRSSGVILPESKSK